MGEVDSTVTIARPVESVYQHFLDLEKTASDPKTIAVTKQPPGTTVPGTLFTFDHGKGRTTTMRFTSLEPNRRIDIEGDVGPCKADRVSTFRAGRCWDDKAYRSP
jgi:hypothetical protein